MRKLVAVIVVDQDWQLCLWGIVKDNETDVRREENAFIIVGIIFIQRIPIVI